ncbi:MAG: nucleotide exchange factor GrpE [Chitinispirillales bacterium]|jgi:molecular chaperone GrpE|nr:nucleotide exchange factor GrpE [Chitinispirillales bacterium]
MAGTKTKETESIKIVSDEPEDASPASAAGESPEKPETEAAPSPQDAGGVEDAEGSGADVDALKLEIEAGKDRYLRLMAEFDNYKRRAGKEYERLIESANEKLILEMVDVRENFDRALKSGEAGGEFAAFYDGMKLIFTKFDEVLARSGLTVFAEAGEPFDPTIHDALMKAAHAEVPADRIAEVFERGYRLKDKVVKHARVIVSSGDQPA